MKLAQKYPLLGSSIDPDEVSMTIKGIGIALIPLLIAILKAFDINVTENLLVELVNSVATIASSVMIVYGIFRKIKK